MALPLVVKPARSSRALVTAIRADNDIIFAAARMATSRFRRGAVRRASSNNALAASCAAMRAPFSQATNARSAFASGAFLFMGAL